MATGDAEVWRLAVDAIDSPVLLLEPGGVVRHANRAACELAQLEESRFAGHRILDAASGEPWTALTVLAHDVEAAGSALTRQAGGESGTRIWDLSGNVLPGDGPERVVLVARDVTRLVHQRESLRKSQAIFAMGALVAGVAHEVRNPLFAISASLDNFEDDFGDRPEFTEMADTLRRSVDQLSRLMADLLAFGRAHQIELKRGYLHEVVEAAVSECQSLAAQRSVALGVAVPEGLELPMDRPRLTQVLQNVLQNAIHHSPAGGSVLVSARRASPAGHLVVELSVRDGGPGFTEADIPHLFEPFFSKRAGGTGMGLSIAQRIVELHHGRIVAANAPGGGALVTIRLPLE